MEKNYRWERFGEDAKVRQYKWEFLRRNEEYQKDYLAFANKFPQWIGKRGGLFPKPSINEPEARSFFNEQVEPAAWKISERWYIYDPIDPALPLDTSPPRFYRPDQLAGEGHYPPVSLVPAPSEVAEDTVHDYFSSTLGDAPHTPNGLRFVQVQLDIAQPLETLFAHLEIHIEIARSRYRVHIGPLPDPRKRPRQRSSAYDSYLKVWDLRKQGLTFEEIAFILLPGEMENLVNRSTLTKRVRSQFRRAQELIDGDYRQIEG